MTNDLKKQIPAYKGDESYAFVCYSHQDADSVYADLKEMGSHGINLWYDEGISAGSSWRAEIAAAISGAKHFIFYISDNSLKSSHCLREVDYALNHDIEILPIYLEECSLPAELDLVLNRVQALFRKEDSRYMEHLLEALLEKRGLTALSPKPKTQKFSSRLPIILIGLIVLLLVIWQPWNPARLGEPTKAGAMTAPAAYDRYLEGLELMVRWDKDDNLETAIGLFQQATMLDPDFALAYARLAGALRFQYAITREDIKLSEAVDSANKALSLNPGLAPVQVALGRIHTTQGNYDLAFAALERALSIDPNDAEANQAMAKIYERQGRLSDAEASFKKAMALDQESLVIRDSYANFLYRQGNYDEAASQWEFIVNVAPDHFSALVNLGSTLSEIGNIPEAISMYERAIGIRPTYMAYSNLGTAYSRVKRFPEAVDAYRKALEIDDSDSLAWGNLAFVYSWMNGMDSQAVETFEHAIELAEATRKQKPRDSYVHSDLALYYAKTGQPELALQRLETAIAFAPDSGEIQAAAAEAYELIGQRDKAVELALKSLELGIPKLRFQHSPDLAGLLKDPRMQSSK
jgi:tetratricopeptide (TPR) repeat protein